MCCVDPNQGWLSVVKEARGCDSFGLRTVPVTMGEPSELVYTAGSTACRGASGKDKCYEDCKNRRAHWVTANFDVALPIDGL